MFDLNKKTTLPIEKILNMGESTPNRFAEIMARKGVMTIPSNSRIQEFVETHNLTDKYPVKDLYRWHMLLTASCYTGRKELLNDMGVDLEKDEATVPEFFDAVKGKHGTIIIDIVRNMMEKKYGKVEE